MSHFLDFLAEILRELRLEKLSFRSWHPGQRPSRNPESPGQASAPPARGPQAAPCRPRVGSARAESRAQGSGWGQRRACARARGAGSPRRPWPREAAPGERGHSPRPKRPRTTGRTRLPSGRTSSVHATIRPRGLRPHRRRDRTMRTRSAGLDAGARPAGPRPCPAHERRGHAPRLCPERSPAPDLSGPLALGVPPRHKPRPHALRPPPCPVLAPGSRTGGSAPRQLKGWQFWEGGAPCPPLPPPPPLGPLRVRALSRQKGERSGPQQLGQICREMRCRKIANP